MNQLQTFSNAEFGSVRTILLEGEPWFVGKDVAAALGYSKPRNAISAHVDDEDKKEAPIQGPLGGTQSMAVINESGLYALIFGSKLPSARAFKRKLFGPCIRGRRFVAHPVKYGSLRKGGPT